MLTPTYVNLNNFSYPIGNTPAVNFFRDRPLCDARGDETHTVKLLSIACGDPRNLLFSLWYAKCTIDFMCCDIDPAVLARNVVLFTLVADQAPEQTAAVWHIFYHLYISESHLLLLQGHLKKLMEYSTSLDTWASSPYGSFICFLSQDTLYQLRRFWSLYAETRDPTLSRTQKYEAEIRAAISAIHDGHLGQGGSTLNGARSAGVHWGSSFPTMSAAFRRYWKTGVAGGNRQDVLALSSNGKGRVNPMFAISSSPAGRLSIYHGSDPLLGFHLPEAFNEGTAGEGVIDRVVRLAKSQFRDWCESLARYIKNNCIRISIHCGDAIRLCHELQSCGPLSQNSERFARLYVAPWTSKLLALEGLQQSSWPAVFDVIDTSNLVDHIGLLNVLPAVVPLLRGTASSVLYTESLLQASEETSSALTSMLCSDITTMSLMIGLTPVGHLLGFTTDFVGAEAFLLTVAERMTGHQRQYRMRVSWKSAQLGDIHVSNLATGSRNPCYQVGFDAEQLAEYFFTVYHKMFASEDVSAMLSEMGPASVPRQALSPLAAERRYYYTRLSLVVLIRLVKRAVHTDWQKCMECFIDKVSDDRQLLIGMNSLQELYLHLHLFGLWDSEILSRPPREHRLTPFVMLRPPAVDPDFLGQHNIPSVVFVALVIPRMKLDVFTSKSAKPFGTPGLHISVENLDVGFENSFFTLQCFFGKLRPHPHDIGIQVVEDGDSGWLGSADMIATFPVPAYMLLLGTRKGTRIGLKVNTTPSTVHFHFGKKLGIDMTEFECGLDDERHVRILREAPGVVSRDGDFSHNTPLTNTDTSAPHVKLDKESRAVDLQYHMDFHKDTAESKSLVNGATVSVVPSSPCTVLLKIGNATARRLIYPFPVNGASPKVRIARKTSWVEVLVPLAPALYPGGYNLNPFPTIFDGAQLLTWGMSRLRLEQQPVIPISGDFEWISRCLRLTLSDRERAISPLGDDSNPINCWLRLKESISIMFRSFVGMNETYGKVRNFELTCKHKNGTSVIMIFASSIRHDRDSGSLVMDAYVMPLTLARIAKVFPAIKNDVNLKALSIAVSEEESLLWTHLLPAIAERCRHTWTHSDACEYRIQGRIPLLSTHGENPICSCGEGRSIDCFPKRPECKPFARYATRVAISPICAVPYVESLRLPMPEEKPGKGGLSQTRQDRLSASNLHSSATVTKCSNCGKGKEDLKTCVRCGKARYCDQKCQKEAWESHKRVCGKQ